MRIYKLYALTIAGANDAIAQLDIVEDGYIVAINVSGAIIGLDNANDMFRAELNFSSGNTLDNNDVRQSIFEVSASQNITVQGAGTNNLNHSISGLEVKVIGGERIYVHSFASVGVNGPISFHVYVKDGSGGKTRLNRR